MPKNIDNLSCILSDLFDYVETEHELNTHLIHYHRYYNNVKQELKSEYAQCAIEKLVNRIEENLKHICHCYVINMSTFGFLGDSIVEAANSGLKEGGINVSTTLDPDKDLLLIALLACLRHLFAKDTLLRPRP